MCCGMRDRNKPKEMPWRAWQSRNRNFNENIHVPASCCKRAEWLGGCRKHPTERDTWKEVKSFLIEA